MNRDFDEILNTCIDRIMLRGESVEQCLESYPERATELEPLLHAALEARKAFAEEPRREFQREAKSRFLSKLVTVEKQKHGLRLLNWQRRWAVAVCAVLALLIMFGGTVGASTNALPGDLLYSVKTAMERVQAFFTFGDEAKANLYIELAERRVAEIEALAVNRRDITNMALLVMRDETERALVFTSQNAWTKDEVVDKLVNLTSTQKQVLVNLVQSVSTEAKARIRIALSHSENTYNRALTIKERLKERQDYEISPWSVTPTESTPALSEPEVNDQQHQSVNEADNVSQTPNAGNDTSQITPLTSLGGQQGDVEDSQSQETGAVDSGISGATDPQVVNNKGTPINTPPSFLGGNDEPSNSVVLPSLAAGD